MCCPVCFDLLRILAQQGGQDLPDGLIRVRGQHDTLFPVDLPPWLSPEVMRKMVECYRGHLLFALRRLLEDILGRVDAPNLLKKHRRLPSDATSGGTSDNESVDREYRQAAKYRGDIDYPHRDNDRHDSSHNSVPEAEVSVHEPGASPQSEPQSSSTSG